MDFELVLTRLLDGFDQLGVRYALMGGFALGALGAPRATRVLDFLVHRDDLARLHDFLVGVGYRRIYHSENVSQYEDESIVWGLLDFVHAFRALALEMLEHARARPIFAGSRSLRVLRAEDVIGLKVQAMANQPDRKARETADIQALTEANPGLDWSRIEQFYDLFEMQEDFQALRRRFHA